MLWWGALALCVAELHFICVCVCVSDLIKFPVGFSSSLMLLSLLPSPPSLVKAASPGFFFTFPLHNTLVLGPPSLELLSPYPPLSHSTFLDSAVVTSSLIKIFRARVHR